MKICNLTKLCLIVTSVALLSGCVSMSTMQTARTTPKNEFGAGGGLGSVKTDFELGTLDTLSLSAPFLEAYGRYGITDRLDVGLKFTIIGTVSGDVKYQFIGDQTSVFAGSVGAGLGYMSISSGDTKSKIFDFNVPLYLSVHPAEFIGFYTRPNVVFRLNAYDNGSRTGTTNSIWYGATGGLRLGKKTAFFLEYSYFKNNTYSKPFSQFTGGVCFGIR